MPQNGKTEKLETPVFEENLYFTCFFVLPYFGRRSEVVLAVDLWNRALAQYVAEIRRLETSRSTAAVNR
eukprot:1490176-Amphidinium_carterae.1